MSESKSRPLKISLSKTDLNGKYGDDVEFTADLSTVKDVITGAVGAIGPENCLKLGGGAAAATALYVLVRSIRKNWPWLQTTNVEKDVLEVSVPPKREKQFTELMETKVLEQRLVEDFKNLKINLEGILGEETFDQCGEDVLKLLKDIRIKSIGQIGSDYPEDLKAMQMILGNVNQQIDNKHDFFGVSKDAKGTNVKLFVGSGASMTQTIHGGGDMMIVGHEGKEFQRALDVHQNLAGRYVAVKILIKGEKDKMFEREFKQTATIGEVSATLMNEEEKFYRIFRGDTKLSLEMTLAEAAQTGSTVNWRARV